MGNEQTQPVQQVHTTNITQIVNQSAQQISDVLTKTTKPDFDIGANRPPQLKPSPLDDSKIERSNFDSSNSDSLSFYQLDFIEIQTKPDSLSEQLLKLIIKCPSCDSNLRVETSTNSLSTKHLVKITCNTCVTNEANSAQKSRKAWAKSSPAEKLRWYGVTKLRILAVKYEIKNYRKLTKQELIEALESRVVEYNFPIG